MPRPSFIVTLVAAACSAALAGAHEFWIDPSDFTPAPGATITADFRVGQTFSGASYSYLPQNYPLVALADAAGRRDLAPRIGDRPALSLGPLEEGLHIIVTEASDKIVNYRDWETFSDFVTHKDAAWALEEHKARGLPETGFREVYSRHAKSLVAVGKGQGSDAAQGLEIEIVALENPYAPGLERLPVQVLYQGAPRGDAQVEIFAKGPDGAVAVSTTRTDADGVAQVPLMPGHDYLVDSVLLREPSAEKAAAQDAVWESLWASLTFAVPAN